jgi:hypothetical protein
MPGHEVVAFLDNDPARRGGEIQGRPVLSPSEALALDLDLVVVASLRADEMIRQLRALGVPEERIERYPLFRLLPIE